MKVTIKVNQTNTNHNSTNTTSYDLYINGNFSETFTCPVEASDRKEELEAEFDLEELLNI